MTLDKIEPRVLIRHCWKRQLSTRDAAKEICDAEGEGTVHYTTVSWWYKRFDSGDLSVEDQPRSGRPSTLDNEDLRAAVNWRQFLESHSIRLCSITYIKWVLCTRSFARIHTIWPKRKPSVVLKSTVNCWKIHWMIGFGSVLWLRMKNGCTSSITTSRSGGFRIKILSQSGWWFASGGTLRMSFTLNWFRMAVLWTLNSTANNCTVSMTSWRTSSRSSFVANALCSSKTTLNSTLPKKQRRNLTN